MRVFTTAITVRGYELDAYGHVNNAVYLNYAEWARWCMIKEAAGSMEYFKSAGLAPVVARVEVDYKRPCYLGEELVLETRLMEYKRKVVVFQHQVKKPGGELATEIRATLVAVGAEGRAQDLPADFQKLFQ
jgi:YbgC/YbaW family acyl-CoA thioester hydrolase